jgi:nitroimidazol reductase NimA-like FMN-containing flavoprotein (pyridoxamine 5'-phosphate oxidase superfamily)
VEREIEEKSAIEEPLRRAIACGLAVCDGDIPHVVLWCFGGEASGLDFHSAPEGREIEPSEEMLPQLRFE